MATNRENTDELDVPSYQGIGWELRGLREAGGQRLEDVAAALKIQLDFLRALEDGRFVDLPGPAYAIGFLRSYATFLGIDAGEAVREFKVEQSAALKPPPLNFPQPMEPTRRPALGIILIILFLVILGYVGWIFYDRNPVRSSDAIPAVPKRLLALLDEKAKSVAGKPETPKPAVLKSAVPKRAAPKPAAIKPEPVKLEPAKPGPAKPEPVNPAGPKAPAVAKDPAPRRTALADIGGEAALTEIPKPPAATPDAPAPRKAEDPVPEEPAKMQDRVTAEVRRDAGAGSPTPVDDANPPPAPAGGEKPAQVLLQERGESRNVGNGGENGGGNGGEPVENEDIDAAPEQPQIQQALKAGQDAAREPAKPAPPPAPPVGPPAPPRKSSSGQVAKATAATGQVFGAGNQDVRIVLVAREDAWVQVKSRKNELLITQVLRAGDRYRVPNRRDLLLTTGNAGGLDIVVDGKVAPALGPKGMVRHNIALTVETLAVQ